MLTNNVDGARQVEMFLASKHLEWSAAYGFQFGFLSTVREDLYTFSLAVNVAVTTKIKYLT